MVNTEKRLLINGKVLLGDISGIERTSWELLRQWDCIIKDYSKLSVEIVVPNGFKKKLSEFKNIKVVEFGKFKNLTLWQQFCLPLYVKKSKGIYVGLANSSPFAINRGFVILHDVSCLRNKNFYSLKHRIKFRLETRHIIKSNFKITTVSHFSAKEISDIYDINEQQINVIGNGWEHINRVNYDDSVFERYKELKPSSYYFSLSSLAPNKNFQWIMETAKLNPDETFAIGGGFKKEIYGNINFNIPSNVIMLGRVTDEEAKSLLSKCKAFLFPTLYEGFGIPPLEAYACGAVSLVSDTDIMHEIYGNSVSYIDISHPCGNIGNIVLPILNEDNDLLARHSWKKYGEEYLNFVLKSCLYF